MSGLAMRLDSKVLFKSDTTDLKDASLLSTEQPNHDMLRTTNITNSDRQAQNQRDRDPGFQL